MKIFITVLFVAIMGCKTNEQMIRPSSSPGPHALVYKTKANYNNLVPVILSDDKSLIVSYPDPRDLKTANGYPFPTSLQEGYLLDNRGIGKNVAFLSISYEDYARLPEAPSLAGLYGLIIDKDPLTELYDCGLRTALENPVRQINKLIKTHQLRATCKSLK